VRVGIVKVVGVVDVRVVGIRVVGAVSALENEDIFLREVRILGGLGKRREADGSHRSMRQWSSNRRCWIRHL
jgi:hypothetical protein